MENGCCVIVLINCLGIGNYLFGIVGISIWWNSSRYNGVFIVLFESVCMGLNCVYDLFFWYWFFVS